MNYLAYISLFIFGCSVGYVLHPPIDNSHDKVIDAVVELNSPPQLQEYQIRLELDSAYIYDKGRLVGSCAHGNDGIDSVILNDNL